MARSPVCAAGARRRRRQLLRRAGGVCDGGAATGGAAVDSRRRRAVRLVGRATRCGTMQSAAQEHGGLLAAGGAGLRCVGGVAAGAVAGAAAWSRRCSAGGATAGGGCGAAAGCCLLRDRLQHISRLGDVREIDLGLDFVGSRRVRASLAGRGLRFGGTRKWARTFSASWSSIELECVFFSVTPTTGSDVENRLALDFQFPGQIVDSNLTHPPFLSSARPAKSS